MRRKTPPDIKALKDFVRVMDTIEPHTRSAVIAWLVEVYLGIDIRPTPSSLEYAKRYYSQRAQP